MYEVAIMLPIDYNGLFKAILDLAEVSGIYVRVPGYNQWIPTLISAGSVLSGLLVKGFTGLAISGVLGAYAAYENIRDKSSPLHEVLNIFELNIRIRLVEYVVQSVDGFDATNFMPMMTNNASIQQAVLKATIDFVERECHL